MRASYLKFLLAACVIAPVIAQAGENNPFVPSSATSPEIEQRLRALEERAMEAERRLGEMTMDQLPGVDVGLLDGVSAAIQGVTGDTEIIGRINGKCLIKRSGSGASGRLEEAPAGSACIPGTTISNPTAGAE